MKTCVRFHHRQGHPLLVLPQCPGLVTRSHAGWRQTCFCYRRGAHLADYVCKNFTLLFFSPCFSLHPTFNLPVQGSEELSITLYSCEHPGNTLHTLADTNTKKKRKKEKSCFNSRAKASSSVLCYTAKLTLGMFVIVLPMKLHCNPFQLPPSLTHPPSSSPSSSLSEKL